jgi:hypothetical protein
MDTERSAAEIADILNALRERASPNGSWVPRKQPLETPPTAQAKGARTPPDGQGDATAS